jgi:acyl carrier protein
METYKNCFANALNIQPTAVVESLEYGQIPEWDSIGHMALIAELEDSFQITFETEDVIDFSSFRKGIDILKKYNVAI